MTQTPHHHETCVSKTIRRAMSPSHEILGDGGRRSLASFLKPVTVRLASNQINIYPPQNSAIIWPKPDKNKELLCIKIKIKKGKDKNKKLLWATIVSPVEAWSRSATMSMSISTLGDSRETASDGGKMSTTKKSCTFVVYTD